MNEGGGKMARTVARPAGVLLVVVLALTLVVAL
jgi:Tfp pilus assembly protein PilX